MRESLVHVEVVETLPEDAAAAIAAFRTPGGFETLAVSWTLLMQDANPDCVALRWAIARRQGEIRAIGALHIVRRLALGDYIGNIPRRITAACRRIGYVPLAFDVAYLEIPLSNREGLIFAPDADGQERATLADAVVAAFDDALAADAICIRQTVGEERSPFDGHKLLALPFVDRYVMELPGNDPTAAAWLAARSQNRRANIRKNLRIFEGSGASLETLADAARDAALLAQLYDRTAARALERGEMPNPLNLGPILFERLEARLHERYLVRVVRLENEIIAFTLILLGHDTLFWRFVGMDYVKSPACRAYFRLVYDVVETAAKRGMRFVDMGGGTPHVKVPLGCQSVPTSYRIGFRRSLRYVQRPVAALLDRQFRAKS